MAKDTEDKEALERLLRRDAPSGLTLDLNISAPRPVVAPFLIRFLIDEAGARFDTCAADSEAGLDRILEAAEEAGVIGGVDCLLALGTPSTRWGEAAASGINALAAIGPVSYTHLTLPTKA